MQAAVPPPSQAAPPPPQQETREQWRQRLFDEMKRYWADSNGRRNTDFVDLRQPLVKCLCGPQKV